MAIKLGNKAAVFGLQRAGILPQDEPHEFLQLEKAAIAFYRDPVWRTIPDTTEHNGFVMRGACRIDCNEWNGCIDAK